MKFVQLFLHKIKSRETPFWDFLYRFAKSIKGLSIPAPRFIFLPLYYSFKFINNTTRYILQKFFFEPIFKSRCLSCGKMFTIQKGIPSVRGNLRLRIGNNVTLSGKNTFAAPTVFEEASLIIGNNTHIGYGTTIFVGKCVEIWENCLIAGHVMIVDNDTHPVDPDRRRRLDKVLPEEIKPVRIGHNVWIGNMAFIGKGITIGDNAIVGANAVVLNDVPENAIMLGNPARKFAVASTSRSIPK